MVTNQIPSAKKTLKKSPSQSSTSNLFGLEKAKRNRNNLICLEAWFTLKKIEDFTNKPQVDANNLPRNVRKVMEKFNEDGFIQLDVEKALMLANAQGNLNMAIGNQMANPAQALAEGTSEKELYYSCYISGMKQHFRSKKKQYSKAKLERIDRELEHSDTKRVDIKRVLMRFNRDMTNGYRLEHTPG